MTTNPNEEPNFVSILMREGVRRRGVTRTNSASQQPPTRNIVTQEPTREMQLKNHVVTTPIETMVTFNQVYCYFDLQITGS